MSEDNTGQEGQAQESASEGEQTPDPIQVLQQELKNSKSENSRKLENLQAQLAEIASALKPKVQETPIDKNLIYDSPEEYARQIEDRAVAKAEQRVLGKVQQQNAYQMKVAALQSEYPEFRDESNPVYRKAQEIYQNLPSDIQGTTVALENAMLKAASEMGLVPVSKRRKPAGDDYIPPTNSNSQRRNLQAKDDPATEKAVEFAKIMATASGRKADKDMLDRVRESAKRKSWRTYSEGEES